VNPDVTVGKSMSNKTSYVWGFTEPWISDTYNFPTVNNQDSRIPIPHAPNNGNYLIVTSTRGMYNLPSLNQKSWFEIYDKYETDTDNPQNYFLVTNADEHPDKIFYKEKVEVVPGQVYRMSVDLARLNTGGVEPNVSFIINPDENALTTANPAYTSGQLSTGNGAWVNYHFDYIAPCNVGDSTFVAFRNQVAGGNGNDLALDNLSMKAIIPQIKAQINDCDEVSFVMLDDAINDVFPSTTYRYQWQKKGTGGVYEDIPGSTLPKDTIREEGFFRLAIYTDATIGCPMYSNEIEVNASNNSCLDIANPDAVNDIYTVILSGNLNGYVLENDTTSNTQTVPHEALSVTRFRVGNDIYPAGSTAVVMDGPNQVGVITLFSDGSFIYNPVPSYVGDVPPIEYTITEKNGGTDVANIYISFITYTAILDAACVSCPVDLTIISDYVTPAHNYYLYNEADSLVSQATVVGDTIDFNFRVKESGVQYYKLFIDLEKIVEFPIHVGPDRATWAPNLILKSKDWSEPSNWITETGPGFPLWCTDVTIPGDTILLPEVSVLDAARDITFKSGAGVSKIHRLNYRKAFVEMEPPRDAWAMLSAPLKYIYSADYHADPTWGATAGVDPKIYMRYFDIKYTADTTTSIPNPDGAVGVSVGNFSKAFSNLKESMDMGKGFVLKIGEGENGVFSGTYKFPRLNADSTEVLYKYHYSSTGNWIETQTPGVTADQLPFRFTDPGQKGRGTQEPSVDSLWTANYGGTDRGYDNRYRFVFENGPSIVDQFTMTVSNAGTTDIVGNPYMSHIDFDKFYETNSDNIMPYYRLWNGSSFYSYAIVGYDDTGVWRGLPAIGTVQGGGRYIAPMQAFFVEMKPNKNQLVFVSDSISVAISGFDSRLRSEPVIENILNIYLNMNEYSNEAIVASLPMANDVYDANEDIYKLFSDNSSTPEIYTVANGQAIEINAISQSGEVKTVPIGIRSSQTGKFEISISGINAFDAYPYLYLTDTQENKTYNLKEKSSFVFEKKDAKDIEGRFYIVMKTDETASGIEDSQDAKAINLFVNDRQITVSSPVNELQNVELYDVSGRLLYSKKGLNTLSHSFNVSEGQGVFVLKVKSSTEEKVFKINI